MLSAQHLCQFIWTAMFGTFQILYNFVPDLSVLFVFMVLFVYLCSVTLFSHIRVKGWYIQETLFKLWSWILWWSNDETIFRSIVIVRLKQTKKESTRWFTGNCLTLPLCKTYLNILNSTVLVTRKSLRPKIRNWFTITKWWRC